jgi:hypothetical protein
MASKRQYFSKAIFCLGLFTVVGWIDFKLGTEISIRPVYFFLVSYVAWQFNTMAAGLGAAVVATVCRTLADYENGLHYSADWIRFETAFEWLLIFAATAYGLTAYRRTLEVHRSRLQSMRKMLPVCHGCGSIRGPDGRWRAFDELSRTPFPEVTECRDCEKNTHLPPG